MAARTFDPFLCRGLFLFASRTVVAAEPRVADNRYKLELSRATRRSLRQSVMAFDPKGRLLVIESHTHDRPQGYAGPAGDRIRMFADSDGDGNLDHWSTFAEGFRYAMNLLARDDGCRVPGDAPQRCTVARYGQRRRGRQARRDFASRNKSDYPHNGLSGIAFEPGGKKMLVSLGENLGLPYRLVGVDNSEVTGKDGAGARL